MIRGASGSDPERLLVRYVDAEGEELGRIRHCDLPSLTSRIGHFLTYVCGLGFGDSVLFAYPTTTEVVDAFLGCLFHGIVPVLAPPPESDRHEVNQRAFESIAKHTSATAILSTASHVATLKPKGMRRLFRREPRGWPSLPWYCTDEAAQTEDGALDSPGISDLAFYQVESIEPLKVGKIDHRSLVRQLRRQTPRVPKPREPHVVRLGNLSSFRALHKIVHSLYIDSRLNAPPVSDGTPRRRRRPSWDFRSMEFAAEVSGPTPSGAPMGPAALVESGPMSVAGSAVPRPVQTTGSQPTFSAGRRTVSSDLEAWKRRLKGD